jgi:uncharacterized protein (DUF1697 family)
MKRYAAFLRGVMPTNCKMADLVAAFEAAGFEDVRTLLGSGNVLFGAKTSSASALEKAAEAAMQKHMGKTFMTQVRSVDALRVLLDSDPYAPFRVSPKAKRIVTFLRKPPKDAPDLPIEKDGARILLLRGTEVLSAYVPSPKGPVFMTMLEKTFGKDVTTRTWDTIAKAAK